MLYGVHPAAVARSLKIVTRDWCPVARPRSSVVCFLGTTESSHLVFRQASSPKRPQVLKTGRILSHVVTQGRWEEVQTHERKKRRTLPGPAFCVRAFLHFSPPSFPLCVTASLRESILGCGQRPRWGLRDLCGSTRSHASYSPWSLCLRGEDSWLIRMSRKEGTFARSRWCGVKDICIILGFCETYRRPEASLMRQGTAVTVLVESHPVLAYFDASWGSAPNPGIFRFTPMA